jgi:hypothetical protein
VGWVAEGVERAGDGGEGEACWVPSDAYEGLARLQACLDDAGQECGEAFDKPNAGGAVDAFEIELDGSMTGGVGVDVERGEEGVIEFAVSPAGGLDGGGCGLGLVADVVVAFEAAGADDGVGGSAAVAAELIGGEWV